MLAYLKGERGRSAVRAVIARAALSTVNLGEVLSKSPQPDQDLEDLAALGVRAHDFTSADALEVARLYQRTRSAGLSIGDRACIALASRLGAPVLTSDAAWGALSLGVVVRVIR